MDMYATMVGFFQDGGPFMYPIAIVLGIAHELRPVNPLDRYHCAREQCYQHNLNVNISTSHRFSLLPLFLFFHYKQETLGLLKKLPNLGIDIIICGS